MLDSGGRRSWAGQRDAVLTRGSQSMECRGHRSARGCVDEGQPVDGVQRSQVSERLCCQSMERRAHRCRLPGQHESRGENPGVRQRRRGAAMTGARGDVVRLLCQVLPFASVLKSARCGLSN